MIIQHNIMAMGAYRNYMGNTNALSKNLEKLSSGYRINRAGDDAAGLAISEKMRAQITGLDAAQKNVQDGISLVQTAEGALQEVQDMLNRMTYLATQSANGTYDNEVDRANLQKEVEALSTEIDRIADSSNFNGINLLDGSMSTKAGGVETVKVSGADRILTDVAGKNDNKLESIGSKSILDAGITVAANSKATLSIDLSKLSVSVEGTTAATKNSLTLDIELGGETFSLKFAGTSAAKAYTATNVATYLKNVLSGSTDGGENAGTATSVKIGDVEYALSNAAINAGVLKLTALNDPTTEAERSPNVDISVSVDAENTTGDKTAVSGMHDAGVQVTEGKIKGDAERANTVFEINAGDIVDGGVITIGDKSVILKVGRDSTTAATANATTVIDLTDMEEGEIDLNLALTKIAAGFGASVTDSKATDALGNKVQTTLSVGVTDGKNGHPIGLSVRRTDTGANAYTSLDKLSSVFSMKYEKETEATKGLTLQIGDSAQSYNQLSVDITDMHVKALGLDDIDIGTQEGAQAAVDQIKDAINQVSAVRGDLGATQNRLEHTAKNLAVMEENIQDAESSIRDTDIAEEMMAYTKNNILIQSAQAMLAQANTVPQGVLQLLG